MKKASTINNFTFGVEFETEYNQSLIGKINKDRYHGNEPQNFGELWKAESDGSLGTEKWGWGEGDTVELISEPFRAPDFPLLVAELRKRVNKRAKRKVEFSEVFNPNKTCGHHIHFSSSKIKFKEKGVLPLFFKIRTEFFKQLKKEFPSLCDNIKKHYARKMAKRITTKSPNIYYNRYYEFNLTNEEHGLEWRSFNVLGVKTWAEYEGVVSLAIRVLTSVLKDYTNGKLSLNNGDIKQDITPPIQFDSRTIEVNIPSDTEQVITVEVQNVQH